jgi:hypothetical protein
VACVRKILETLPPLFSPFIRSLFIRALLFAALGIPLLIWPKAPLRLIVDRVLEPVEVRHPSTLMLTDRMECGHVSVHFVDYRALLNAYTEDATMRARRHRCHDCAALALAKKPVRSVAAVGKAVSA